MSVAKFSHVKILGIQCVVPEKVIDYAKECASLGEDPSKIQRAQNSVGFGTRHVADASVTATDLAEEAASLLLRKMKLDPLSVDACLFVVQNPDFFLPAGACLLHGHLGLSDNCLAFDISQGCSGYVYGLYVASSLLEQGHAKRVLLCAADTPSHFTSPENRVTAPVFGDAGTATLLEYDINAPSSFFSLGTRGKDFDTIIVPMGGARLPVPRTSTGADSADSSLREVFMRGVRVFHFTMDTVPPHIHGLLDYADTDESHIYRFVPHQANKQIMQMLAEQIGFPLERTIWEPFTKYGNQTIASIPCALCDCCALALRGLRRRYLISGFGVGLSWASCVLDLGEMLCADLDISVVKGGPDRSELIAYWKEKTQKR